MTIGSSVTIKVDSLQLEGNLLVERDLTGIVIFAHGSGSSRFSSRNNYVAQVLAKAGFATLLFDLLTPKEDEHHDTRFDISLLSQRLVGVTKWVVDSQRTQAMRVGYFGASTGAAAALQAAAELPEKILCVVSRGGRPDLAWEYLPMVRASTLLIVGGRDDVVLELNKKALERIPATKKLEVVPGATHLFEEPGALEKVAQLAAEWFTKYL